MISFFGRASDVKYKKGQAALIASIFFMLVSLAILGSVGVLGISHLERARDLVYSRKSYATAESGLEDAVFRIVGGMNFNSGDYVYLNNGKARVDYTNSGGERSVSAYGDVQKRLRNVSTRFTKNAKGSIPFPNALGSGFLGVVLEGNTTITHVNYPTEVGNVFSNGSINGSNGNSDLITGNTIVAHPIANDSGSNLESFGQYNPEFLNFSGAPSNSRVVHDVVSRADVGQSFISPITAYAVQAKVYMRKVDSSAKNFFVYIIPNDPSYNSPGGRPFNSGASKRISSANISASSISMDWEWVTINFSTHRYALENEKYWLVFDFENSFIGPNYRYEIAVSPNDTAYEYGQNNCYGQQLWCNSTKDGDNNFGKGTIKYTQEQDVIGQTWTPDAAPTDMAFKIFMGESTTAYVDGGASTAYVTQAYGIDVCKDLKANTIVGTTDIAGNAYYHNISGVVTADTVASGNGIGCGDISSQLQCRDDTNPTGSPCDDTDGLEEGPFPDPIVFQSDDGNRWQRSVYKWKGAATSTLEIGHTLQVGTTTVTINSSAYIDGGLRCYNNGILRFTGVLYVKEGGIFEGDCKVQPYGTYVDPDDMLTKSSDAYIIFEGSGSSPYNQGKISVLQRAKFYTNTDSPNRTGYVYVYSLWNDITNFDSQEPQETIVLDSNDNYGGGAFFAPYGEIRIRGNAEAISLNGARLKALQSSTVNYETGVSSPVPPLDTITTGYIPKFIEFHEIE